MTTFFRQRSHSPLDSEIASASALQRAGQLCWPSVAQWRWGWAAMGCLRRRSEPADGPDS